MTRVSESIIIRQYCKMCLLVVSEAWEYIIIVAQMHNARIPKKRSMTMAIEKSPLYTAGFQETMSYKAIVIT